MDLVYPSDDPSMAAQTQTYTGTAGNTANFNPGPAGVLVWCTTDAYVKIGEVAIATTASTPIPAYTPVCFRVPPGSNAPWRVSAIQVSAGGSVFAKPLQA